MSTRRETEARLSTLADAAQRLQQSARSRHRATLLLQGQTAQYQVSLAAALAKNVLDRLGTPGRGVWLGLQRPPAFEDGLSGPLELWLGQTIDVLVIDLFEGIRADRTAALSGCVRGGGLVCVLIPDLPQCLTLLDPECQRLFAMEAAEAIVRAALRPNYFLIQIRQSLLAKPDFACLDLRNPACSSEHRNKQRHASGPAAMDAMEAMEAPLPDAPPLSANCIVQTLTAGWPALAEPEFVRKDRDFVGNEDQRRIRDRILERLASEPATCMVLTADRGRGKSTTLGLVAGEILNGGSRPLTVVARSRRQVQTLLYHAHIASNASANTIHFCPPDQAQDLQPMEGQVILVDEAATLSAVLLHRLLALRCHLILATTLAGYEGTGRGFALKLMPQLEKHRPGWSHLTLTRPVRWASGDPLEAWIDREFLAQQPTAVCAARAAEPCGDEVLLPAVPAAGQADTTGLPTRAGALQARASIQRIDWASTMVRSTVPLQAHSAGEHQDARQSILGLLSLAHYRTTPDDFRSILDSPALETYVGLNADGKPEAAAVVALEGPLSAPARLKQQILAGKRRPRGHLTQLALVHHLLIDQALDCRIARIARIVVEPAVQGRGLGKRLLRFLQDDYAGHAGDDGQPGQPVAQACDWRSAPAADDGFSALSRPTATADLLSASFALSIEVLEFWLAAGFQVLRLGLTRDTVSGSYSALVGLPLSPVGEMVCRLARHRSRHRYALDRSRYLHHLETELGARLDALFAAPSAQAPDPLRDQGDFFLRRALERFANGEITLDAALPGLLAAGAPVRDWLQRRHDDRLPSVETRRQLALWTGCVQQAASWEILRQTGLCSGRKDGITRLRVILQQWLASTG